MIILAFETSCDDTSIALFRDDTLLVMKTRSQVKEHAETSGVVPEVAARLHANVIFNVLEDVLEEAGLSLSDIDYIACTSKPGLLPSLMVGMTVAKTLSHQLNKPLLWIDHIQAHIFANLLERKEEDIQFPAICLTVSGGHNELYLWKGLFELELLWETLDDSAGEAFDKVAKMMGLGYPGGPVISRLSSEYTGNFTGKFPKVLLDKESLNFSFSGLKSAVKREVDERIVRNKSQTNDEKKSPSDYLTDEDRREIAFEFEKTAVNILSHKLFLAAAKNGIKTLVLAGGVSANDRLNADIKEESYKKGYSFVAPIKKVYSMDNAAMIGILAYYRIKYQK